MSLGRRHAERSVQLNVFQQAAESCYVSLRSVSLQLSHKESVRSSPAALKTLDMKG